MAIAMRALSVLTLLVASLSFGCSQRSDCEKICIRVVECRRQAPAGEEILGEKKPAPDPACLERCQKNPEGFSACEAKEKLCPDLLDCAGH